MVDGASIDSRAIAAGQLFVPIVAERDGHDFIAEALAAGAPAYLTAHQPQGGTAVTVSDTGEALIAIGGFARQRLAADVLAITGSVGKTTTKDLVAGCLASTFPTVASEKSLNNELGVPLTLCNAREDVRWVVLEMGARGPGHIAALTAFTFPKVGVVTRVALAHIETFGDLDGVFEAKRELVSSLPSDGVAILNADDALVARMADGAPCPVLTYGIEQPAEVQADGIEFNGNLQPTFTLHSPWGSGRAHVRLHGAAQVSNALAAAAAALWCGVPFDAVVSSLAEVAPSDLRMDVRRPAWGPVLIIDCYNANPASTEAALRSLAALEGRRKVALLGRMAELGDETERQHRAMAELAADLGVVVFGYQTDLYGGDRIDTVEEAVVRLISLSHEDCALIKGSRAVHLEDVVSAYGQAIGEELV
jgi:UDP-N-acetylmuramoyl-tripeptide--D-alanyl-D-alanine ligase